MRYESIQYFVGRLFYAKKNKNIKYCVRSKMGNKAVGVPGNRRFIFCKLQKNKAAVAGRICSMLKSTRQFLLPTADRSKVYKSLQSWHEMKYL